MTLVIDPACTTCSGTGKVMGGDEYHDCPGCRLKSRYQSRWCDNCHEDRPVAGIRESRGEYGNTYTACARCVEVATVAHEASVEAQYRDRYGDDFDKLATYNAEGR